MHNIRFVTLPQPSLEQVNELETISSGNPFCTRKYCEALGFLERDIWLIGEACGAELIWGSLAILETGRFSKGLSIPSIDTARSSKKFWNELTTFCRANRIDELTLNSFSSSHSVIPSLPGEQQRFTRHEYWIDLNGQDLWKLLSSNHKRNVKKSQKAGVQFRVLEDSVACSMHAKLQQSSMDRRMRRGEKTPMSFSTRTLSAYVQASAGKFFQAYLDNEILSSVFVLYASQGAYYQSAGTSRRGMECGASQALVHEICRILQAQSVHRFSLGGVRSEELGLERFKAGFGGSRTELDAVTCFLGSVLKQKIISAVRSFKHGPLRIIRDLCENVERFVVYGADTASIHPPSTRREVQFETING